MDAQTAVRFGSSPEMAPGVLTITLTVSHCLENMRPGVNDGSLLTLTLSDPPGFPNYRDYSINQSFTCY